MSIWDLLYQEWQGQGVESCCNNSFVAWTVSGSSSDAMMEEVLSCICFGLLWSFEPDSNQQVEDLCTTYSVSLACFDSVTINIVKPLYVIVAYFRSQVY